MKTLRAPIVAGTLVFLLAGATAHADHPVFDLLANRTLAHGIRAGGLAIPAGEPGFAKYVHFNRPLRTWHLDALVDGHRVALANARAVLELPLTSAQTRIPSLVLRIQSRSHQTVRASVGHQSSSAASLHPGWQTVSLSLPAGALRAGENRIVLTFSQYGQYGGVRASAAIEWILVGASPPGDDRAPLLADAHAIYLPRGGGVAYYVQVPTGGALALAGDAAGCSVRVRALDRNRALIDTIASLGAPVSLASIGGRVIRLEVTADGAGCSAARLTSAALTLPGPAPTEHRGQRPRNVIFWMSDDTRADRFDLYNPKTRVETPVLDALAKRSTVFRAAYVQGNESRVSHASLWTSMYPAQHHFISEHAKLDPKFDTLAEVVRPSGRFTAGFMANGFIDKFWGFGQGWDILHNFIHEGGGLKAEDLVRAARGFLSTHGQKPFFMYLGTIDVHVSWRAHQPWLAKYDPTPYSGPFVKGCLDPQLDKIVAGKMHITERDKTRICALYDSDVSYNDHELGELLKTLSADGQRDDTMIIYTADHGEELWDHGKIGHGQSLREELVHVPLVIDYPPLFPPGKVVDEGVEASVDLLPTIADALGVPAPKAAQGESLIPIAEGVGAGYPRPAISSQYELAHSMRLGRYKLWVGGSGEVRLYDVKDDPGERRELASARPIAMRFVSDAMGIWMAYQSRWHKSRWGVASNQKAALADDLEGPISAAVSSK